MSAAALADWLASGAVTVPGAGFVTLCPESPDEKVTQKNDSLRGRKAVCDLVTSVTAFSVGVEDRCKESRPDQAANDAQAPAPAPAPDWRQADGAYLTHHFTCPSCCAAGHGRGDRCTTGAELWATYEAACEADRITNTKGRSAR